MSEKDVLGKNIDHFELKKELGVGGMGIVYKAWDSKAKREVALKVLHGALSKQLQINPEHLKRLEREAAIISRFKHPNVCAIYELAKTSEGFVYISMPLYKGETLAQKLLFRQLKINEILKYGKQIAEGLNYVHGKGVIHRDVKPSNIFLTSSGVIILDFGLAKIVDSHHNSITKSGDIMGTIAYIAPEQVKRTKEINNKVDIWSWGVIFFEMLTGKAPFGKSIGGRSWETVYKVVNESPQSLNQYLPDDQLCKALQKIVDRCLQKDTRARYDSFREIIADIDAIIAEDYLITQKEVKKRYHSYFRFSLGFVGLGILIFFIWFMFMPTITVKEVIGMSQKEAERIIQRNCFLSYISPCLKVNFEYKNVEANSNRFVINISPNAKGKLRRGSQVELLVSSEWKVRKQDFNGTTMVLVPAGSFRMGSTEEQIDDALELCDKYRTRVTGCERRWFEEEAPLTTQSFVKPFWIDETEVTRAAYELCVLDNECTLPPSSKYSTTLYQPINNISWYQAAKYCQWRDARLPTEAEWEYAARGPSGFIYPWGNATIGNEANHCDSNCPVDYGWQDLDHNDNFANPAPVGSYPNSASWVGALDMAGNVWEWTTSLYINYPYTNDDRRNILDGEQIVNEPFTLRGGSFVNSTVGLRSANRIQALASDGLGRHGFRCVHSHDF